MTLRARWLIALALLLPAGHAIAVHPDLLQRTPCDASDGDYGQYLDRQLKTWREESTAAAQQGLTVRDETAARAGLLTKREYVERHGRLRPACERLVYRNDNLKVIGYVWRARRARDAARQPILLFNRGGALEDSKLRPNTQFGFHRFVQAGYLVVGSQYRGNDGGEGRDELGGADVADVLKLLEIARTFDDADPGNAFALGYSRGGMQSLLAARRGADFRAVATVGLPADFLGSSRANPRSARLLQQLIPDFAANPEAALRARSALSWPEEIRVPLLLIAGSADPVVAAHDNSIALAARLGALHKTYELVVYEGDTHGVMINARDRDERIIRWFRRFALSPGSTP